MDRQIELALYRVRCAAERLEFVLNSSEDEPDPMYVENRTQVERRFETHRLMLLAAIHARLDRN